MLKSEEVFISLLLSPVFPAALMIKACKFAWIHEARASALVRLSPWTWCSLSYLLYFPLIKVRRWTGRRKMKKLPSPLYPTQSIQFRKHVENDTLQRPFSQGLNDFYWCQQRNLVANGFQTRIQIRQCCWWSSPSCDSPLYRRGTSTLLDDIYLSIFSTMRKNYTNQELYLYEMDETFHSKALSFFFFFAKSLLIRGKYCTASLKSIRTLWSICSHNVRIWSKHTIHDELFLSYGITRL